MTLVEFLSARLDEDAQMAEYGCDGVGEYSRCALMSDRFEADWKAKRRIVDLITFPSGGVRAPFGPEQEAVLRYLAEVYADHPDYQEEWRP